MERTTRGTRLVLDDGISTVAAVAARLSDSSGAPFVRVGAGMRRGVAGAGDRLRLGPAAPPLSDSPAPFWLQGAAVSRASGLAGSSNSPNPGGMLVVPLRKAPCPASAPVLKGGSNAYEGLLGTGKAGLRFSAGSAKCASPGRTAPSTGSAASFPPRLFFPGVSERDGLLPFAAELDGSLAGGSVCTAGAAGAGPDRLTSSRKLANEWLPRGTAPDV